MLRELLDSFDERDVVVADRFYCSFMMLAQIAACPVADYPGRSEPRVLKRRRHRYPLMQRPRAQLRQELQEK